MKVERRDGSAERQVITALIMNKAVLGPVAARWERGREMVPSPWAAIVGDWCVAHFKRYDAAPRGAIQRYFLEWAESGRDDATVRLVEDFLAGLSDEYERLKNTLSPEHLLDVADDLFNRVKAAAVATRIQESLEVGDVKKAWSYIESARRVEVGSDAGIDLFDDEVAVTNALESRNEDVLITLPDGLGGFFGSTLARGNFIAMLGSEKKGKSFWLIHLAWCAAVQGRNVAYFECGDLGQKKTIRRFAARAAGRPLKAGEYRYPTAIEGGTGAKQPEVSYETRRYKHDLTAAEAIDALATWRERVGGDRLKIECRPNTTMSVATAESILDEWARDDWHPDVCVFDYADIMLAADTKEDERGRTNSVWKGIRALTQKRHCLGLTATQTNKEGYTARILGREHFSEDHRKLAHVDGMAGINQNPNEKDAGLYRLNWPVGRDLEFSEARCVWCAGSLAFSDPGVVSTF